MTENEAKKALAKLFQCFSVSGSDEERKIKLAAYWEVLSGLPAEYVVASCRKAARGDIGNRGFLPTAAELYQTASAMVPRKIIPLIEEYISPKERDAAANLIRELVTDMKMLRDMERPPCLESDYKIDIESCLIAQYRDKPMPKLSDELRAKLGAGIPEIK